MPAKNPSVRRHAPGSIIVEFLSDRGKLSVIVDARSNVEDNDAPVDEFEELDVLTKARLVAQDFLDH